MASQSWDPDGDARRALQAIVDDPQYGTAALSRPMVMTNLLKDLLPDAPREAGLLIAAAEANLAGTLRGSKEQGVDADTACRLASVHLEQSSAFTSDACEWVTGELATVLGYQPAGGPQAGATEWAAATNNQPTGAAQPGPPHGTQWAAAADSQLAPTAGPGWHPQYQQNSQYPASPRYSQLPPTGSYQAQAPVPDAVLSPQHDQFPQFPSPQFPSPQFPSPQYASPQYASPQYASPQYASPQYAPPRHLSPGPGQVAGALAPPPTIRSAVRLMYIGAVLAVLQAIVGIVPLAGAALLGQPVPSASDVSYVRGQLISYVVVALISIALWLWLAWASNRGRSWSRIVSAVVFALATGVLVVSLIAPANSAGRIIFLASWVVGLLAVISQWQRSSSVYYRARRRRVTQ